MLIPGSPLRAPAQARLGVGPQAALSILCGRRHLESHLTAHSLSHPGLCLLGLVMDSGHRAGGAGV